MRDYRLPLIIKRHNESFEIRDAAEVALAFVYYENEPSRRDVLKRVAEDEGREIAKAIARHLTLVAAKPKMSRWEVY